MTLRRCLLLALLTAAVLCVGFVALVVRVAVAAAGAVVQVLVQGALFFGALSAIPYFIAHLVHLTWFASLPRIVLSLVELWSVLVAWWGWLSGS